MIGKKMLFERQAGNFMDMMIPISMLLYYYYKYLVYFVQAILMFLEVIDSELQLSISMKHYGIWFNYNSRKHVILELLMDFR